MRKDLLGPRARTMPSIEPCLYKWSVIRLLIHTFQRSVMQAITIMVCWKISQLHEHSVKFKQTHASQLSHSHMKDN